MLNRPGWTRRTECSSLAYLASEVKTLWLISFHAFNKEGLFRDCVLNCYKW